MARLCLRHDRRRRPCVRRLGDRVDNLGGKTRDVLVDTDDGRGVKTLRTTYATKSNAMRAARREYKRLLRGSVTFNSTLAHRRADLYPEMHITVRGFKPEIDTVDWIIVKAEHPLGNSGFITRLELEYRDEKEPPDSDV